MCKVCRQFLFETLCGRRADGAGGHCECSNTSYCGYETPWDKTFQHLSRRSLQLSVNKPANPFQDVCEFLVEAISYLYVN